MVCNHVYVNNGRHCRPVVQKGVSSGQPGEFPPEVLPLLQALVEGLGITVEQLTDILAAIGNIQPGGGGTVQGYPNNCDDMSIAVVNCPVAMEAQQVPAYTVPNGFPVKIKAHPDNVFGSRIFWSTSPAANPVGAEPLMPNDFATAFLKDTGRIYVFSNIAGSQAVISVEHRSS